MKTKTYQPISCNFYDELEALATLKKRSLIRYLSIEGNHIEVEAIIVDLYTKNKEEFMQLDNGLILRLDQLVEVDGKALQNYC